MKRVVTIGGGTGTFVVLSALRKLPGLQLSAIVSSADDGGSTGRLRDAYGFLPLGDARQALVALADAGHVLRDLFAYRFAKGDVQGHNLGNLFLTALTDLLGSDTAALAEASKILRVSGNVIPASDQPGTLIAHLADGTELIGQHRLNEKVIDRAPVAHLHLETPVPASEAALAAVKNADVIILGPGDLYASTIAPTLPEGMKEALQASSARIIYILNLFTKMGETGTMTAKEHLDELVRYIGREPDHILMHAHEAFDPEVLARYNQEGETPVHDDLGTNPHVSRVAIASVHSVPPVPGDPVQRSLARHDPDKLAEALHPLLA